MPENPFGKVDETGTVFVRYEDDWHEVGQYPDGTHEEALALFERKFADLEGQVRLLEQRVRGGANASDIAKSANKLAEQVAEGKAVGDLAALATRLRAITEQSDELAEQQREEQRAALAKAEEERTQIVLTVEAIAARDLSNVKWKDVSAEIEALFAQWKAHQANGPRLPKSTNDALWKRFRAARTTVEAARRQFFAQLDAQHKQAKTEKQLLIDEAKALAPKGADGIPAYRSLLDRWKAAGRAGRKVDDALWAEFKAAGDVLFDAKAEIRAAEDAEFAENLVAKRALLDEAKPILDATDRNAAREALTKIQREWDEVGKVPRDSIREVEDGLRRIEQHVRSLDEQHWNATNPERKARSEGLAGQLEESIEQLEVEITAAKQAKNDKKVSELESELETKRQWLEVARAAG
ncbi:MAG TPA: DUF349 domain-containing protein [Candidatus Agrococcus pullicola]|uniref:DUF349 domain-containing protein n=1 Tax=Candidatus Agrococcus pullicola TaxID=2838429 RepID=A0A9D1YXM7_9MICO|nr:DUF349 domain-containing protein [Candidatus Agrococcus pullicola]